MDIFLPMFCAVTKLTQQQQQLAEAANAKDGKECIHLQLDTLTTHKDRRSHRNVKQHGSARSTLKPRPHLIVSDTHQVLLVHLLLSGFNCQTEAGKPLTSLSGNVRGLIGSETADGCQNTRQRETTASVGLCGKTNFSVKCPLESDGLTVSHSVSARIKTLKFFSFFHALGQSVNTLEPLLCNGTSWDTHWTPFISAWSGFHSHHIKDLYQQQHKRLCCSFFSIVSTEADKRHAVLPYSIVKEIN